MTLESMVKKAAPLAGLVFAVSAEAAPLGDPLNALPSQSTPYTNFEKPVGSSNLSAADGQPNSPVWVAGNTLGTIFFYNGANPVPIKMVDCGYSNLSGVAFMGNDHYLITSGSDLIEGVINGSTWSDVRSKGYGSTFTDVDYTPSGLIFAGTTANGVRLLNWDGTSTLVDNLNSMAAVKAIEFLPDTYNNSVIQLAADSDAFKNLAANNTTFGYKDVYLNNGSSIEGIAYFNGGFAVVQAPGVEIHNPLTIQENMKPVTVVPEPSTLGGAVLLGMLALRRQRRASSEVTALAA